MNIKLLILTILILLASGYTLLVHTTATEAQMLDNRALEGKLLWQKHNCTACHQLYGLGGYMGPDLTNVLSAKGKGKLYVHAILQTGTARMPNFNLSKEEIEALILFLENVDKSGQSPVYEPSINVWGNINIK